MLAYNVRTYNYLDGQQIRVYKNLIVKHPEDWVMTMEQVKEQKAKQKEKKETENKGVKDEERSNKVSQNRTIQKIYEITRSNMWDYFITLTFNPEKVDSFNYEEVTQKLSDWLHNLKKWYAPDLRYIIVPELHKSGRYHFHGMLANCGNMNFIDSGKVTASGDPIYNIGNYNLGFTTATRIKDNQRVSAYITKYITKELCASTTGKKRYWASRNLDKAVIEEYVLKKSEIDDMIDSLTENIDYAKTLDVPVLDQKVRIYEVKDYVL